MAVLTIQTFFRYFFFVIFFINKFAYIKNKYIMKHFNCISIKYYELLLLNDINIAISYISFLNQLLLIINFICF